MSKQELKSVFNNVKTVTKKDILPLGDWIELSKQIRTELITSQTSRVEWFNFEKEALYHFFRNYNETPARVNDEVLAAKPLAQRIIGAHGEKYDNNFLICRLLGYAVINLRMSHILDKDFENRFYCNDQQHAFMYEYKHIHQDKSINLDDFKKALKDVVSENGTSEDNSILKEINQWVEKAESNGEMRWSQVTNSVDFPLLKQRMEEPMMVEFTYTNNQPATNKTQKINDNPYGWGDYHKLRNQLSHNEKLYETVFTQDGNNLEYFLKESKSNPFFSTDGVNFLKKQYFATNAQPTNQEYHGEIEAAFLKLLMTFIDEEGNIDFKTNGIAKKDLKLITDGSMYPNLELYVAKWNKLDEQLTQNFEETKTDIEKLRTYFFEYLKGIESLAKSKTKKLYQINREFAQVAKEHGEKYNHSKQVLNIKDMRLTKLENALWFMKNSIILSELYSDKTGQPVSGISTDYVNTFYTNLDKFLNDTSKNDLLRRGSSSDTRYDYLQLWNSQVFKILSDNLKNTKVTTDPTMRKKQNELFSIAKSRNGSFLEIPGYYFCPTESIWLTDDNTDLGHDLLKKFGRKANMETIFIQNRKMNRTFNKGNFPSPKNYYVDIINSYDNALSSPQNVKPEHLSSMIESKGVLEKVVEMYDKNEHLSL